MFVILKTLKEILVQQGTGKFHGLPSMIGSSKYATFKFI